MTDLKKALFAFWSRFGIPAYLDGCVPDDAVLPYITYNVSQSDFGGQTVQTAFVWCKDESPYGNAWRTQMMDTINDAFPVNGRFLVCGDGYAILYRNEAGFLQDWQDPNDPRVIGARVSYIMQQFNV